MSEEDRMPLGAGAASLAEKLIAGMENLDVVGEDPRVSLLMAAFRVLQEDEGVPSDRDAAELAVETLDRLDEQQGVVRVNLAKQRAIEADRDRLRGVVHAMLQAFEAGEGGADGPTGAAYTRSIWVPESMFEGWRLAAEGGR